jgi:hypothetical protein
MDMSNVLDMDRARGEDEMHLDSAATLLCIYCKSQNYR